MIALREPQAVHNGFGDFAAIECHTGETILLGIQEVAFVAFRIEDVVTQFKTFRLDVLHADHVGILLSQPVQEATVDGITYTIDINAGNFHKSSLLRRCCMIPDV